MRNVSTAVQIVGCAMAACGLFLLTGVAWTMVVVGVLLTVGSVLVESRSD